MDSCGKFWIKLTVILSVATCLFAGMLMYHDYAKTTEMARLGFHKTTIVGKQLPVYQKIR